MDVILQHCALEASMQNIVFDFDVDSLEDVSEDSKMYITEVLEDVYATVISQRSGSKVFLAIKKQDTEVSISVSCNDKNIFKSLIIV